MTFVPSKNDAAIYSDVYKDTFGCRPRGSFEFASEEAFNAEMDNLSGMVGAQIEEDRAYAKKALADLFAQLDKMVADFCIDKGTALRWVLQAESDEDEIEFYGLDGFCYERGIEFSEAPRLRELAGV